MYVCNSAADIPGWTSVRQHMLFSKVLDSIENKNPKVLEVGSAWGRSTWAWLDVLSNSAELNVVDWFLAHPSHKLFSYPEYHADKTQTLYECNYNNRQIFDMFVSQHKNYSIIKNVYEENFFTWTQKNIKEFDIVYTDAAHSNVLEQLEYFSNVPVVCGDDITWDQVKNDVGKYCDKNRKKCKVYESENFFIIYN